MSQQLSIFDLPLQNTPTKRRYPNPKKAKKFRDLAERMQSQIDNKLNPAIGQQRPTRRRARIAASMREDGEKLALIQAWLYAMADALDEGTLPRILSDISTKTQEFREWLEDKCIINDPLPQGSFLHSDRSTGVNTRILVLDK